MDKGINLEAAAKRYTLAPHNGRIHSRNTEWDIYNQPDIEPERVRSRSLSLPGHYFNARDVEL